MATVNWPWAIILCKFNDVALEPQPIQFYEDLYTQSGTLTTVMIASPGGTPTAS